MSNQDKYCNCGDVLFNHLKICPFCEKLKINDSDLLEFYLAKHNIDYEEIKEEYINYIENKMEQ